MGRGIRLSDDEAECAISMRTPPCSPLRKELKDLPSIAVAPTRGSRVMLPLDDRSENRSSTIFSLIAFTIKDEAANN